MSRLPLMTRMGVRRQYGIPAFGWAKSSAIELGGSLAQVCSAEAVIGFVASM